MKNAEYNCYTNWMSMRNRCNNPTNKNFKEYGGRGITVCPEWDSFKTFLSDMGDKPSSLHSLDRIDNSKGYRKENCRWVTHKEQSNNRRGNRPITSCGLTLTVQQWAEALEVPRSRITDRLNYGWSAHKALFTPKSKSRA